MNKEKIIVKNVVVFGIVLYVIYFIFKPHYMHEYYYSADKKNVVTAIHYYQFLKASQEKVYFTFGYYDKEEPPVNYLVFSRTHEYILHWKNNTLFIYTFNIVKSSNGVTNTHYNQDYFNGKIKVERLPVEVWNNMRENKSDEYIYRYSG